MNQIFEIRRYEKYTKSNKKLGVPKGRFPPNEALLNSNFLTFLAEHLKFLK